MTVAETTESKLDVLRRQEAEMVEQVEAARDRMASYPEKIRVAREESFFSKPSKRPLMLINSPLQKLLDAEKKDLAALNSLEADLSAIRNVIAVEDARVRDEQTAEARKQIKQLHVREEAVWKRGGELIAELAASWNQLVEIIETEDRFASQNRVEGPGVLAVEPAPATFHAFLDLLFDASVDPTGVRRAEPVEEQLTDYGFFGRRDDNGEDIGGVVYDVRPGGTRKVQQRRPADHGDRLFHLTPDLRNAAHALREGVS